MINQIQTQLNQVLGRLNRRYAVLLVFTLLALFLWAGFAPTHHITSPSGGDVHGQIKYVPSSYDWSKAKIFHPVKDMMSPPQGKPQDFPRVQARTRAAAKDAKADALRAAVKKAFLKSWNAYKKHAWAQDELEPLTGGAKVSFSGWAAQLVDVLDCLWIMDLKDEFHLAVKEVAVIDWSKKAGGRINLFEVTIRYLGGLIAAYDLSGERALLDKAVELGNTLYATYDTPNRLPSHWLEYDMAKKGEIQADTSMSGAAGGTLCLEFTRLTQLTGDPKYYDATERIKQFFYRTQNETKIPGIWPKIMDYRAETVHEAHFAMGSGADSQYEYLPKMDAILGGLDPQYKQMTVQALETTRDILLYRPMTPNDNNILAAGKASVLSPGKLEYIFELEHLSCFAGGMYAMAGKLLSRDDFVDLGSRLTAGCVWAYDSTPTNIMPETSRLVACEKMDGPCPYEKSKMLNPTDDIPAGFQRIKNSRYILRPEAIESVFYMWRITGDKVWREAAERMWEGIVAEAETDLAFASVTNVLKKAGGNENSMETFWMGETLKYFYLTFADESVINLDEWVFNTEAHPFKRPARQ